MNAGTAWSLLGLTIRLAQGLGLHRSCPNSTPAEEKTLRSKVWWAIIWQDSLLSITYDRASSTATMDQHITPVPQSYAPVGHYYSSMYRLCKVGLDIVRDRATVMTARETYSRINEHRDSIQSIMRDSAEYLRDSRMCTSLRESLEHWALYLHSSYILAELCRPAISSASADSELARAFKQFCIDNLVNCIEAFLGLQNITPYASQSWASVHRALSSALLLGIMGKQALYCCLSALLTLFRRTCPQPPRPPPPRPLHRRHRRHHRQHRSLRDLSADGPWHICTSQAQHPGVQDAAVCRRHCCRKQ